MMASHTFLSLPAELRRQIYEAVIPRNQVFCPRKLSPGEGRRRYYNEAQSFVIPPLMAVGREVRAGTIELFFGGTNAFCFLDLDTFEQWVSVMDCPSKLCLKRLAIGCQLSLYLTDQEFQPIRRFEQPVRLEWAKAKMVLNSLQLFPNLIWPKISINLKVDRHPWHPEMSTDKPFSPDFAQIRQILPAREDIDVSIVTVDQDNPLLQAYETLGKWSFRTPMLGIFKGEDSDLHYARYFWTWSNLVSRRNTEGTNSRTRRYTGYVSTFIGLFAPKILDTTILLSSQQPNNVTFPPASTSKTINQQCVFCSNTLKDVPDSDNAQISHLSAFECPRCDHGPYCSKVCQWRDTDHQHHHQHHHHDIARFWERDGWLAFCLVKAVSSELQSDKKLKFMGDVMNSRLGLPTDIPFLDCRNPVAYGEGEPIKAQKKLSSTPTYTNAGECISDT